MLAAFLAAHSLALGGEIGVYHLQHARDKTGDVRKSRSHDEVDSTSHGITEMGIERSTCFGECPAYTFIVKSDGTFRYHGLEYVERKGEHTGTIPVRRFHDLAQFVKDSGYFECEDSYRREVTGPPGTYTMVVMSGKTKTVRNFAQAAPTKVWAIEQLIDGLMTHAKWDESRKAPDKSL